MTASLAYRFLALGDSYTIGESVGESERWPVQLVAALRRDGVDVAETTIIARTGWTTDELSSAIEAAKPNSDFDLVSLLIGVNDQYRGRPVESYRAPFTALLDRAIGFARGRAGRVVVLSIPDWGVTPFASGRDASAIARDIDAYNSVSREATTTRGAHYVDITPISRRPDASLIAGDGLHPSAKMYAEWVSLVQPVVRRALLG